MKKIISIVLVLIMILMCGVVAMAAEKPTIRISHEGSVEPGSEISIIVTIENNPGIAVLNLPIKYDGEKLEKISYTGSGLEGWQFGTNATWVGENSNYNGVILTLKFKVKEDATAGEAVVNIPSVEAYNTNEEVVDFTVVPGGVTVNVPCKHTDTKIINAKEATCYEKGYTGDTYCNECKTIIANGSETDKNPDNHVGGTEVKGTKEATCAEKGYTGDTHCKGCGAVVEKGTEIAKDADNHVGGTEVKGAKEATCCEKGYTGDTHCKGCGAVVAKGTGTDENPDNHVGGTEIKGAKEATCTEKGYTGDTHCKGCGAKLESGKEIEMLEHKGGKATCCEKAKCEVCGNEYGEVDADAHTLNEETVKEPTCTEKGEIKITCENGCGYEDSKETEALGHDWGEWVTVKEATYDEEGLKERVCERTGCVEKESEKIEKLEKPSEPSKPSKPSKPNSIIIGNDKIDESNPNTGAAVKCGSVIGAVTIVAVVAVVAKRKKQ